MSEVDKRRAARRLETAERWTDCAREEFETIWIERGIDRQGQSLPPQPREFYSDTLALIDWISARYAAADVSTIQQVYEAVAAWHRAGDATGLPTDQALYDILDAALLVVNLVRRDCLQELGLTGDEEHSRAEGLTDLQQQTLDIIRQKGPISGKEICDLTGGSESGLRSHIIPALRKHGVETQRGSGYVVRRM